ncbi:MAG TPA: ABC transporter permease [Burkholderiaceae bacterium]|nr:ABC transporter permease [Burkholderiaceae bacterium]
MSTLLPADLVRAGSVGLRSRRTRALLSALGIAIGIAAMVGVLGLSSSSKADLIAELDALGTNLLTVSAGQTLRGEEAILPRSAPAMIERIGPVEQVSAIGGVSATVRRTDHISESETGGIAVVAAELDTATTLGGTLVAGRFLDEATDGLPTVVLGAVAAERLGVTPGTGPVRVLIGDRWFTVIGILSPMPLAPEMDRAALVGWEAAESMLDFDGDPSAVYVRTDPDAVDDVRTVLAATANPEAPEEVSVSRPSDALAARAATDSAFTALLLGLGSVALLVGGVGIANVMVIAVLERRSEIGLRRALGATRRHIALQFLTEALLLSALGGGAGVLLGALATAGYSMSRSWQVVVPLSGAVGGFVAAVLTGVVAGSYPAVRAARLAPTDALRAV